MNSPHFPASQSAYSHTTPELDETRLLNMASTIENQVQTYRWYDAVVAQNAENYTHSRQHDLPIDESEKSRMSLDNDFYVLTERRIGNLQREWYLTLGRLIGRQVLVSARGTNQPRIEYYAKAGEPSTETPLLREVRGQIMRPLTGIGDNSNNLDLEDFFIRIKPNRRSRRRNKTGKAMAYYLDLLNPQTGFIQLDLSFE